LSIASSASESTTVVIASSAWGRLRVSSTAYGSAIEEVEVHVIIVSGFSFGSFTAALGGHRGIGI
jgi:hypothetical protein